MAWAVRPRARSRAGSRSTGSVVFDRSAAQAQPTVETLVEAARDASQAVWERMEADPALEGMGTTLTAVAVLDAGRVPAWRS